MNFAEYFFSRHIWIIQNQVFSRDSVVRDEVLRVIILDLDGTLWPDSGPGSILKAKGHLGSWKRNLGIALDDNFRVVICTNQTLFCRDNRLRFIKFVRYLITLTRIVFSLKPVALLVCHHHPNSNYEILRSDCPWRKPSGALIDEFSKGFKVDLTSSLFVGDRITDAIAAQQGLVPNVYIVVNHRMFEESESKNYPMPCFAFFSPIYKVDLEIGARG